MNRVKRGVHFSMLKHIIAAGNVTIIGAADFRVPPKRNNFQIHGYRITAGSWQQNIVILPIDDDKPMAPSAISTVRNMLVIMGFSVSPIMLTYSTNNHDYPTSTNYTSAERN